MGNLRLNVKGPNSLNDEIRREEDPLYTKVCIEHDILAYLPETAFTNRRILDFGCGAGASSIILARMFPQAEIDFRNCIFAYGFYSSEKRTDRLTILTKKKKL